MPDRYIGRRTADGGWKWEAAAPPKPKKRQERTLILLVAAAGVVTVCLLAATILLASGNDGSAGVLSPSQTPAPAYFAVWNDKSRAWQTGDLELAAGATAQPGASFLLNLPTREGDTHRFEVRFICQGDGQITLTTLPDAPAQPHLALASPGPGRVRPDTTALKGSLAVWGATFTEPPSWNANTPCANGQTLRFSTLARASSVSVIWSARMTPPPSGKSADRFKVMAAADAGPAASISVSFAR